MEAWPFRGLGLGSGQGERGLVEELDGLLRIALQIGGVGLGEGRLALDGGGFGGFPQRVEDGERLVHVPLVQGPARLLIERPLGQQVIRILDPQAVKQAA